MKTNRLLIAMMAALFLVPSIAAAQNKMSYQQYQAQLEQFKQREDSAKQRINELNVENAKLQTELDGLDAQIGQVWQKIYKDLAIEPADLRKFADELDAIGAALDGYDAMSADDLKRNRTGLDVLQKRIDKVAENRAAVLSRYKTIINRLNTHIDDLKSGRTRPKPEIVSGTAPETTPGAKPGMGPSMTSTPKSRETLGGMPTKKGVMYTVIRGDYLWKIAAMKQHYGDGMKWMRIYSVNRNQIKNPDLIYPKQVFYIPFEIEANQVLVRRGQSLSSLAEELYDDPFQWRKLYEANKGLITNPTTIYPEMILAVPGR
ncbi:MAG: LysM peptidoglycan-binding domain-containing protein [bacterium]